MAAASRRWRGRPGESHEDTTGGRVLARKKKQSESRITGKLKAADPFELIRWLARSQPDPRKALAELVQNALDAGARNIRITRVRERKVPTLHVLDDGAGVIPELDRTEALRYIATHIGHSRKRNLTPEQRRELLLQGQYGIGLLGFWSIGQVLEMRTHVPGQPAWVLRLHEDSPQYEIERLRGRLALGDRFTEIVIRGLHRPAFNSLAGRRMADYLAAELRGQLLARDVQVLVHDRIARGRAPKVLEVRPARFEGRPIELPAEIPVPGYLPIRLELYLLPSGSEGEVAVSASGTTVYADITSFDPEDFRRPPWTEPRLSGLIEFPDFQVPPGTRRGVIPDEAAEAFACALRSVEQPLLDCIDTAERRAAEELEANVIKQLARAFREVPRLAPEYDFFAVRASGTGPIGETDPTVAEPGASVAEGREDGGEAIEPPGTEEESDAVDELLVGGALSTLEIRPPESRVERLGTRRLRALAYDAAGVRIRRDLPIRWWSEGTDARLEPGKSGAVLHAGPDAGTVIVHAEASDDDSRAAAQATIDILDELPAPPARTGIPEPSFVDEPGARWRSQMRDGRWVVNRAHPDFQVASETQRRKLRYLAALLAKEVVLHSFPTPQLEPILERLVEVLTITERSLDKR